MNNICDLYFTHPTNDTQLRFIGLFDKDFKFQEDKLYNGYVGTAIHRVKLIPMINSLRRSGIEVYSVPIDYRERASISKSEAFKIAEAHAQKSNMQASFDLPPGAKEPPLFWIFPLRSLTGEERIGGTVVIDRIDGHRWTLDELDQYMYDYNNLF